MSENLSETTEWFWRIVDEVGLADVPSDEQAALRLLVQRAARAEARPAVDREAVARELWNLATGCEPGEAWAWEKAIWIAAFWPEAFSYRDLVSKCFQATDAILALLSPATSPGEGSSSANRAARIASDHAASETLRKSEEG